MIDLHLYAWAEHGLTLSVPSDARADRLAYLRRKYPTLPAVPERNFVSWYLPGVDIATFLNDCRGGFVNVLVGS